MDGKKRQPLGVELVKRGIVTEEAIDKALEYQRTHTNKKLGYIISILNLADKASLIEAIGDILGEKTMLLTEKEVKINVIDYISLDVAMQNKVVPFDIIGGKIKVCFADTSNRRAVETVRLLMLNKGLVMDKYITFESNIFNILESLTGEASDTINTNRDISGLIDTIIKTAMEKRASDIHIEPEEENVRVRYRIDGRLVSAATIEKEKQQQIIGRLKAISNMHQEKQDSQDGRILLYPDYNIRVSSQRNVYGEKFVLRLLKKNSDVKRLFELGFPQNDKLVKDAFEKRNCITVIATPTGEGKTTTLYSIIDLLNSADLNVTTIEDPVEIRIPGLNQIEIDPRIGFTNSLRTVLRQDPDIILVGEIRDNETAEIALQAGQTGHYVLSTIHTIEAVEVVTRLRKMGISDYDISSTLATSVSQRLVRKMCPYCARERDFTNEEIKIINQIGEKYNYTFNLDGKKTYTPVGCQKCNQTGFYDRIAVYEILLVTDKIKDMIASHSSTIDIKKEAMKEGFEPLPIDGINKVLNGITTLEELNNKLLIF